MAPTKTQVAPEATETETGARGTLSPKVKSRLEHLASVIDEHEAIAKKARTERDALMMSEIRGGVAVTIVAEAAHVTRQHVYKNVIDKGR